MHYDLNIDMLVMAAVVVVVLVGDDEMMDTDNYYYYCYSYYCIYYYDSQDIANNTVVVVAAAVVGVDGNYYYYDTVMMILGVIESDNSYWDDKLAPLVVVFDHYKLHIDQHQHLRYMVYSLLHNSLLHAFLYVAGYYYYWSDRLLV